MTYDRFHLLQEFLHFSGEANSRYDPNDGRRGCCHQVCPFTNMKSCCKLSYPKNQLSVGKALALFRCQLHFKRYIKTKRVCFGVELCKLTSSNDITLNLTVNSRNRMFHNGNENSDMSAPERTPFYQLLFLLLVTPDIAPVSGNNDALKRLSSFRYFSSKKLQEGASLSPHEKLSIKYCIATGIKTDKGQP